jgi:hypothetical protein
MVVMGPMVKIVFMEQGGQGGPTEPVFFRSAVTMSHQDAIQLKNLLTGMLADLEKQFEAFRTQTATSQASAGQANQNA